MATRGKARRVDAGEAERTAVPAAVAFYARVSTEEQKDTDTVQAQLTFLRRYVDLHGLPVAGEYVDEGVSGAIPLHERPDGQRLLTDAEAGRFGTVLFMRVRRLGRSLRALLDAHDQLDRLGVAIRSGTEPLDTATPIGRFIFQLLGSVAELDRETIAEQTSRGRDRVAAKGQYTGGPIPVGLDIDEQRNFILSTRPVPQLGMTEAEMMRDIITRLANHQTTVNAEWRRLNALGVPRVQRFGLSAKRRKAGKDAAVIENVRGWGFSSLHAAVTNPLYKGEQFVESRFGRVIRPVPAIVDAETWQRAQDALVDNRRMAKKNAKRDYQLRGLIRCQNCGASYTGCSPYGDYRRYRCSSGTGRAKDLTGGRCFGKQIPADWLEAAVWQECRQFILHPGDVLDEARRRLRERMTESTSFDERRRSLLGELANKETERERIVTLYRRGKIDDDEADRELDAVAREAGQLRELIESLSAQAALVDAQEAYLTETAAALATLREELADIEATNDATAKREVIERLVRQITVETRRTGMRRLEADVRVALRLKHESMALVIDSSRPGGNASRWRDRVPGR
ncbi:MAG TPA: recombinase family protein [Thermomicrobiales bacterium]|jgi:site-specific DNA recombinase